MNFQSNGCAVKSLITGVQLTASIKTVLLSVWTKLEKRAYKISLNEFNEHILEKEEVNEENYSTHFLACEMLLNEINEIMLVERKGTTMKSKTTSAFFGLWDIIEWNE